MHDSHNSNSAIISYGYNRLFNGENVHMDKIIKEFEMTKDQLKTIMNACKPVPMIMLQYGTPKSQQENANAAWQSLADELGFKWDTVLPISSKGQCFFTAESRI